MQLSQVRGQERVLTYLENILGNDRLHHGLLFAGQDGVGKQTVAKAFANRLLCRQAVGLDACGNCGHCIRLSEGTHADYLLIERAYKSDGTQEKMIKVDQVRTLQRTLSLKSFEGGTRVILILDADRMNASTANALLKTLEEPPENSFFILTSNATSALLPTIISRCQLIRFSPLDTTALAEIASNMSVDPALDLAAVVHEANGSASRLVTMLDADIQDFRAQCMERIKHLGNLGTSVDVLDYAEKDAADKQRRTPYLVIDLLQHWYRNVLIEDYTVGSPARTVSRTKAPQSHILSFLGDLDRIRAELDTNQRNIRIAMEEVWFGVAYLEKRS